MITVRLVPSPGDDTEVGSVDSPFEGVLRGAQVRADGRHDLQLWSHLPGD